MSDLRDNLVRFPDSSGNTILLREYGNKRYLGAKLFPLQVLENFHNVQIRDDDVILCSFPKTGCHWTWEMTRMLLAGTTELEMVEKEKYMMERMSNEELMRLPSPRILNNHIFFHQLPRKVQDGKVKILYIYRNPKDVAVSLFNHHSKMTEYEYKGRFSDYLTGLFLPGKIDFGDIYTYTKDWEQVIDSRPDLPIFVMSYEQLQMDTFGQTKALAKFLGARADDAFLRAVVDKCSFGQMQDRKGKFWEKIYGQPVMYRKGKVGDWKNWFTVAESELMDEITEREMKGSKVQFQYTL